MLSHVSSTDSKKLFVTRLSIATASRGPKDIRCCRVDEMLDVGSIMHLMGGMCSQKKYKTSKCKTARHRRLIERKG